ncbi:transcriptional regulator AhrC/ArgR [Aquisalibacillus elongatus]|uniref:Arginine repressor n=1 Tax=Aquisalibacillus elongatus TaxID=485577 RepID=A0A3N5BDD7_9BACI|nr:transcriptional regulator ArgR [Aquisalibacillus elongatus]RPF55674.1 ArgR family transcriptional regulator [Aquisalibacillus elongatus]
MKKAQRLMKIRELITNEIIETQDEMVSRFHELGYPVTQATISRDIKELQLVKVPTHDGSYKYSLPQDQRYDPVQKIRRMLTDSFVSIDKADHFIVLKTIPGNAQAVGALLDQLDWDGIMGTICGDDTCLIICRSPQNCEDVFNSFHDMLNE